MEKGNVKEFWKISTVVIVLAVILIVLFLNMPAENSYEESDLEVIGNEERSSFERENVVIRNSENWDGIKDNLEFNEKVNFEEEMILGVFMGRQSSGGFDIEIESILETDDKMIVNVKETYPGENCIVTQAITSPYEIAKIPKTDKEIEFETREVIGEC